MPWLLISSYSPLIFTETHIKFYICGKPTNRMRSFKLNWLKVGIKFLDWSRHISKAQRAHQVINLWKSMSIIVEIGLGDYDRASSVCETLKRNSFLKENQDRSNQTFFFSDRHKKSISRPYWFVNGNGCLPYFDHIYHW